MLVDDVGWFNANDTGAFGKRSDQKGLHPGEDWNFSGGNAGKEIFAICHGGH
jgi:hypothetical protein